MPGKMILGVLSNRNISGNTAHFPYSESCNSRISCPFRHHNTVVWIRQICRGCHSSFRSFHHYFARAHRGQQFQQLLQDPTLAKRSRFEETRETYPLSWNYTERFSSYRTQWCAVVDFKPSYPLPPSKKRYGPQSKLQVRHL